MPEPNENTDFDPYYGNDAWWQDIGGESYIPPTFEDIISFSPTGQNDQVEQFEQWLQDEWFLTEEGAAASAPYFMMNPYDPGDEIQSIEDYHSGMGIFSEQSQLEMYKSRTDQQNLSASRGFASAGSGYTEDALMKAYETNWVNQMYESRQGMESSISDIHDEYMDSWWDILMDQPAEAFEFYEQFGGGEGGEGGDEDWDDPELIDEDEADIVSDLEGDEGDDWDDASEGGDWSDYDEEYWGDDEWFGAEEGWYS